jgi:hypothetical protein
MPNHSLPSVADHFVNRDPAVEATYRAILIAARALGPVKEEAKKTSIHLVRTTAFAGIATRKTALVLTLKSDHDIVSPRVCKRERTSANRWHIEFKFGSPEQVDAELQSWLARAYALSG